MRTRRTREIIRENELEYANEISSRIMKVITYIRLVEEIKNATEAIIKQENQVSKRLTLKSIKNRKEIKKTKGRNTARESKRKTELNRVCKLVRAKLREHVRNKNIRLIQEILDENRSIQKIKAMSIGKN